MEIKSISGEFKEQENCDLDNCVRNPEMYQLSIEGNWFVYLPFQQNVVRLAENERQILLSEKEPPEHILKEFLKAGLYIDENLLTTERPVPNYSKNNSIQPDDLVLLLTTSCNKRCKYCYADAGDFEPLSIDLDVIKFVLEKYEPKSILFFGIGEPTMRFDLMQEILSLKKGSDIHYAILTHGEYTPKSKMEQITNFIWENRLKVILSWDGPPEIHDLQRPSKKDLEQKPSSLIERTVKQLSEYGDIDTFCTPRATISRYSQDKLDEIVDYFLSFGFHTCALEPLAPFGRSVDYSDKPEAQPPNLRVLAENMFRARIRAKSKGMTIKNSPFFQYERPKMYPCSGISLKSLVVGPTKDKVTFLSACYHFQEEDSPFRIGKITREGNTFIEELDYNKINKLRHRNSLSIDECRSCPIKCGGGCTTLVYRMKRKEDDLSQAVYRDYCDANRWMLTRQIKYLFDIK